MGYSISTSPSILTRHEPYPTGVPPSRPLLSQAGSQPTKEEGKEWLSRNQKVSSDIHKRYIIHKLFIRTLASVTMLVTYYRRHDPLCRPVTLWNLDPSKGNEDGVGQRNDLTYKGVIVDDPRKDRSPRPGIMSSGSDRTQTL